MEEIKEREKISIWHSAQKLLVKLNVMGKNIYKTDSCAQYIYNKQLAQLNQELKIYDQRNSYQNCNFQ